MQTTRMEHTQCQSAATLIPGKWLMEGPLGFAGNNIRSPGGSFLSPTAATEKSEKGRVDNSVSPSPSPHNRICKAKIRSLSNCCNRRTGRSFYIQFCKRLKISMIWGRRKSLKMDYSHFSCNAICRCATFKTAEVSGLGIVLFVDFAISSVKNIIFLVFVPTTFKMKCSPALLLSKSFHTWSKVFRVKFFFLLNV